MVTLEEEDFVPVAYPPPTLSMEKYKRTVVELDVDKKKTKDEGDSGLFRVLI